MERLRSTVKRDISLFSVEAWERGYRNYFQDYFGWDYPVIFHYDGQRVHFYHTEQHFKHFKEVITEILLHDDQLFDLRNAQFIEDIRELRRLQSVIGEVPLSELQSLIGKIMAFYIFVVSDAFVTARPVAWESRRLSEGILYECDEAIESRLKEELCRVGLPQELSHVLSLRECERIGDLSPDCEKLRTRLTGYIQYDANLDEHISFEEFCRKHRYAIPDAYQSNGMKDELCGSVAHPGIVSGPVRIIHTREDLSKLQEGDILVACMTNATYIFGIQKCAAIVTDEGGITCHAVITARELGKPCITGTKEATKNFKDGDWVEVDATVGIVRRVV